MIEFENHDIIIELTPEGRDGASVTARGEWEADAHYYYLDIVSYNGGSYLAKTDVPAGTLPTNTTYWQVVASNAHWGEITGDLSDQEDLQAALNAKADANSVYTKTEADALLDGKADKNSVYTKTEADTLLAGKANASDVYTKTQVDDALYLKADKADSYTKNELDGIFDGIDNALYSKADADSVYTKSQTNTLLAAKANAADVYNKTAVDNALAGKADKSDTYTKAQVDSALSAKANSADLGTMAVEDAGNYYDKTETDTLLGAKANSADLGTMSAESASDYYDKDEVNDLINASGVVAELDASGAIATFETNLAENLSRLNVSIDPVQDLHGYDNPWPAGGGKNLFDKSQMTENSIVSVSQITDGFILSAKVDNNAYCGINTYINGDFGGKTIYAKIGSMIASAQNIGYCVIAFLDENDTEINGSVRINLASNNLTGSITAPQGTAKIKLSLYATFNKLCNVGDNVTYKNVIVSLENVSYSPYSNICPISGHSSATVTRTGVNIWDEEWEEGTISGSDGQNASDNTRIRSKNYISVLPSTQYYVQGTMDLFYYDSSKAYIGNSVGVSNTTFTASSKCRFIRFRCPTTYGTTYNNDISINYPSTDTAYHAGSVQTVTIVLGDTYYGAQLDAVAGTLTVDRAMVTFDGSNDEVINDASSPNAYRARIEIPSDSITWTSASTKSGKLLSNEFEEITNDDSYNGDVGIHYCITGTHEIIVGFDSMGVSSSNIRTWLASNPLVVVYELATPTVITGLTPAQIQALQGLNNVWADTGDVAVSYFNNSTAEAITDVKQMIASTETSMTTTRNYTSGSLIIVGSALLKATSNISSGASLVIGTNCVRTTLEEWILSLIA